MRSLIWILTANDNRRNGKKIWRVGAIEKNFTERLNLKNIDHAKAKFAANILNFNVSREKVTKKFCFTRNIFYFCGNIGKGSVEKHVISNLKRFLL